MLPEGLRYQPEFVGEEEEATLVEQVRSLPWSAVVMHGVTAKRRTAHFGWLYHYEGWRIEPGPPIPEFVLPLRDRAAAFAGVEPEALGEALFTEYPGGAGIGWHRDAPMFGVVAGISLLSECRMRFQRGKGAERETAALVLEPRSIYVLDGPARTQWQHTIPATKALRYSITFRTLREKKR